MAGALLEGIAGGIAGGIATGVIGSETVLVVSGAAAARLRGGTLTGVTGFSATAGALPRLAGTATPFDPS